jgi:CcmD family protein
LKSYSFLFWAYNAFWLVLAGYLLMLFLRLRRMSRRLETVEHEMQGQKESAQESQPS